MAAIGKFAIGNFRSVKHAELVFPENAPLILVGENNAGKSNIIAAIDIILGEIHPKYRLIEQKDYYQRTPRNIQITAELREPLGGKYHSLVWQHNHSEDDPNEFCGIDSYGTSNKYIKAEARDELTCVLISAERTLNYQLSYQTKWTMLSKLMHRFHQELQKNTEIVEELKGKFVEIKEAFHKIDSFKTFKETLQADFLSLVSCMSYKLEVDFEAYNPTNFFHALRVQAKEGAEPRDFNELGTGEQQVLAISFAHAYAKAFRKGILLAIEEPEAHLHPLAQRWLARKIYELCKDGLQIIMSTHSPAFVYLLGLDGLVLVRKSTEHGTWTKQLTRQGLAEYCLANHSNADKTKEDNILEFYAANTTEAILEGFFAKGIILVEGPTEALAIPEYLKALSYDCYEKGVAVIPVDGKGNLARFWRLFTAYGIPVYVIFDNDAGDDSTSSKRGELLKTLGVSDTAEILKEADLRIEAKYAVFGKDFETTLRKLFKSEGYENLEKEAREFIGIEPDNKSDCKPLVARYVAEKLSACVNSKVDGWSSLSTMKLKIEEAMQC